MTNTIVLSPSKISDLKTKGCTIVLGKTDPPPTVGSRLIGLEAWAVAGSWSDSTTDEEILANLTHYAVWARSRCYDIEGKRFNVDFLGKWRSAETMPVTSSRFPKLRVESVSIHSGGRAWFWTGTLIGGG